jgi:hypothetical protein
MRVEVAFDVCLALAVVVRASSLCLPLIGGADLVLLALSVLGLGWRHRLELIAAAHAVV